MSYLDLVLKANCWRNTETADMWKSYQFIRRWPSRDVEAISPIKRKEERRWSKQIFPIIVYFWTLSWRCQNCKQHPAGGAVIDNATTIHRATIENFIVERVFVSTSLRSWRPSTTTDRLIPGLPTFTRPLQFLDKTSTSRQISAEVCSTCITHPHRISISISNRSWASKGATYVRKNETSFILTSHWKWRTHEDAWLPLMRWSLIPTETKLWASNFPRC